MYYLSVSVGVQYIHEVLNDKVLILRQKTDRYPEEITYSLNI